MTRLAIKPFRDRWWRIKCLLGRHVSCVEVKFGAGDTVALDSKGKLFAVNRPVESSVVCRNCGKRLR